MDIAIINAVKATGLKVYMRKPEDTWLFYTDGTRIGYLENGYRGLILSTCHIPNRTTGTGFRLTYYFDMALSDITFEKLVTAFCSAPAWATQRDRNSVVKFRSMDAFLNSNVFNSEYTEV